MRYAAGKNPCLPTESCGCSVAGMRVGVLGPVEVWEDGRELALGSGRPRPPFGLLSRPAGEVVPKARLLAALRGDRPPAAAAQGVQGAGSQLPRAWRTRAPL